MGRSPTIAKCDGGARVRTWMVFDDGQVLRNKAKPTEFEEFGGGGEAGVIGTLMAFVSVELHRSAHWAFWLSRSWTRKTEENRKGTSLTQERIAYRDIGWSRNCV